MLKEARQLDSLPKPDVLLQVIMVYPGHNSNSILIFYNLGHYFMISATIPPSDYILLFFLTCVKLNTNQVENKPNFPLIFCFTETHINNTDITIHIGNMSLRKKQSTGQFSSIFALLLAMSVVLWSLEKYCTPLFLSHLFFCLLVDHNVTFCDPIYPIIYYSNLLCIPVGMNPFQIYHPMGPPLVPPPGQLSHF